MRNGLSKLQYLLLALLLFALTGCGANSLNSAGSGQPGTITAKLVVAKQLAKKFENYSAGTATKTRLKVTGAQISTASAVFPSTTGGTISVYPGSELIITAEALDASGKVVYEGFATGVTVMSGGSVTVNIDLNYPVIKAENVTCQACHDTTRDASGQNLVADYKQSGHYANNVWAISPAMNGALMAGCAGCHGTKHDVADPALGGRCNTCHNAVSAVAHNGNDITSLTSTGFVNNCNACHNAHNTNAFIGAGCTTCHAVGQDAGSNKYVQDNSGVRAITPEFSKRSHHITGGAPTDAQCVVCHLAGKVIPGATAGSNVVVVDKAKHMSDAQIHLRNADTNADFVWSGTEHSNMDNFCFSCHDSDGAKTVPTTFAGVAGFTGTAANPFGDTLTNGYDQVARAGVVDVKTAFTTTNASHHAVSGQRYTYRFSTLANATAWYNADKVNRTMPAASEIAEGHVVAGVTSPFGTGLTFDAAGPEEGGEATLYEAGKFVASYIPLGETKNVADNSILHCGDCHTVGQWKAGSSTNADGSQTPVAIGAHGSNNEYLLRNSLGTDALHNNLTYVCFNCHKAEMEASSPTLWAELVAEGKVLPSNNAIPNGGTSAVKYVGTYTNTAGTNPVVVPVTYNGTLVPSWKAGWGSLHPAVAMGQITGYAVAHAVSAMHGQCQADSADNIGATNRQAISWAPNAVKAYDYVPAAGATAAAPAGGSNAGSGNITGISCINCHNSGLRNSFGGIHGGNNTYTDGFGRPQTTYRFMPGMGNYRYAPPGGWDGKDVSDPTLLTANNPLTYGGPSNGASVGFPGASGKPMGGCYTSGAADLNPGYSTCNHHGTSTAVTATTFVATGTNPKDGSPMMTKTTVSGSTANFRASMNGGTTSSPTTYEPTVREATAGGALVTRPLKY